VPTVLKSGSLNLPEPSDTVVACTGIGVPLHSTNYSIYNGESELKITGVDDKDGRWIASQCRVQCPAIVSPRPHLGLAMQSEEWFSSFLCGATAQLWPRPHHR